MLLAIVRIKGKVNVKREAEKTMQLLRLYRKHHCSIVPANPEMLGMIKTIERFVTWGEIEPSTLLNLLEKRGRLPGNARLTSEYVKEKTGKNMEDFVKNVDGSKISLGDIPGLKKFFRLKPPSKGFERNGMKKPYSLGGVFGYRGKDINVLLTRMI